MSSISLRCRSTPNRNAARRRVASLAYAVVAASICTCQPASAEWPFERGDALASGTAAEGLPTEPELLWTYQAEGSGIEAAAVISGGIIYVGDFDGTFHAVRLEDGEPVWTKTFEDTGFLSAAALGSDRLFVVDFNGVVRSLAISDGQQLWQFDTDSEAFAAPNYVASQGLVLVTTESGQLLAISSDAGELQWEFAIEAPLRCWPTVVDGRALLAGCDGRAHAVDIRSGKADSSVEIDGPTGSTPAARNGKLYFGTEEGSFYCLTAKPLAVKWQVRDERTRQGVRAAAAVSEEAVVYSSQGKHLFAIDPKTGESLWSYSTKSRIDAAATIAGSTAYLATSRGRLIGVDLQTGEETWTFEAGGQFLAAPSVSQRRLVIGNEDGVLYCFGQKQN